MADRGSDGAAASVRDLTLTRVFDAPRRLVWEAWTDPRQLARWWGPRGFTNPRCEADARPGGAIHVDMRAPDGTVYPMTGRFLEVVAPERLVMLCNACDEHGRPIAEVRNSVVFAEEGGRTRITITSAVLSATPEAAPSLEGMEQGWTTSLERLTDLMTKGGVDTEVWITREFDAPRDLVFRAWTDPAQLARWYAPNGCALEILSLDARRGGEFRMCIRHPKYGACWTRGVYREFAPPGRLAFVIGLTDEHGAPMDSVPNGKDPEWPSETTVTVTFETVGAKTRMTLHQTVLAAVAQRTGALPSWLEMLDRLAAEVAGGGRT